MGLLDTIKRLFGNNKKNPQIIVEDLSKIKGNQAKLEVGLYNNKTPVANKNIIIKVNGVEYERTTDGNGIASLNINLNAGTYDVGFKFNGDEEYNPATGSCKININPVLGCGKLEFFEGEGSKFQCKVTDENNNPISNTIVTFAVNGVSYNRTTDNNGIASLTINLKQGTYLLRTTCVDSIMDKFITVKPPKKATRMEGLDINKTFSQNGTYQCAVYSGNARISVPVKITVNGKTYDKTPDQEGLCKLNINLNPGDYTIKAEFAGNDHYMASSITNKIHISEDPKPTNCKNPYSSSPFHTNQGGGYLGQINGYNCGPHSLSQCYYNLTGIDVSEREIASVAGTTTAGTGHQGLATALAWLNRKYGTNITMEWANFSDVGFKKLGELLCEKNSTVFWHELYRNSWGHYSLANKINTATEQFNILNSLGSKCNSPAYCGYIETRSFSVQKSYWSGISQKSICILRKK